MSLLDVTSLSVHYGGVRAVDSVDLHVEDGEIVGLIGPNGAGKTSLIDAVSGFTPSRGEVVLAGRSMNGLRPHARVRHGMSRTFQSLELFEDMTVRENLAVAAERPRWWSIVTDLVVPTAGESQTALIEATLASVGISECIDELPTSLSNGMRKLVAVARALVKQPRLVLLDEPAAGLNSSESLDLGATLRRLADRGLGMLLVDHDMDLVLSVSDRVYVLDFGQLIAEGPPEALREDERVIHAYLGSGAKR